VWLVGPTVSMDWELIQGLMSDHVLTLIESFDPTGLAQEGLLVSASLIVVDCGGLASDVARVIRAIRAMKKAYSALTVVLVDGGLEQAKVIQAYQGGLDDYFPVPYEARLLV